MEHGQSSSSAGHPPDGFSAELRTKLDAALAAHDRPMALRLALGAVDDGDISIPDLYTLILGPLMIDTGAAWQRGSVRVWEEHHSTSTVRTIVEALATRVLEAAAAVSPRGETVLLTCPPEEYHDLGLRMMLDRFLLAGYTAHFLGPSTPVAEICDAAERLGADLIVLSASTHYQRVRLRETVEELRAGLPDATGIFVGGPAFAHDPCALHGLVVDVADLGLPGRDPVEGG